MYEYECLKCRLQLVVLEMEDWESKTYLSAIAISHFPLSNAVIKITGKILEISLQLLVEILETNHTATIGCKKDDRK